MLSDHRRIAVLGLVVVTVLTLAVSWWTQPTALPGDAERVAQRAAVDSTVDVVVVPSVPPGLTLRSVE